MISVATSLEEAVKVVCPIFGVCIGNVADKQTWRIDFKPEASSGQLLAAQAALDAFDIEALPVRQVEELNARETAKRERARRLEDLERLMKSGAPQPEVNLTLLALLKE